MRLLSFTLNEIQLREIKASLAKLEAGHRARVAWFDDHGLEGNVLSIHALDLLMVFNHCQRDAENEMELFRVRKTAIDQLSERLSKTQEELKRLNIETWLETYKKFWPGLDTDTDLTVAPSQPNRMESIP